MAGTNRIDFTVGYTVDKSGLSDLQNSLEQVKKEAEQVEVGDKLYNELQEASVQADKLSTALNQSWNSKLDQLDLSKLNASLAQADTSIATLKEKMEASGATGAAAYNQFASSILSTNLELQETNRFLDSMATTMSNTLKWGVASSAMNTLSGAVQSAWSFTKELDTSLNNIRIVTEKSADDMAAFAESANTAAKALGASTTDYTNASLIYYQQGLSDEEVEARTDVTLKAANVTGQAAREVSEELTAVWNGYQVTSEEAESSIDILAAVAANTASNLEELSTGMSKVASSANAMGVSEEQLAAQLSTIISATRQAPETTGQALRTIYARMSTINAGGIDEEDGATLTSYSAKMDKFGISVLDANGKLRDMGEVIEEIGEKWDDFTREQQISLAQAMAGTRQYNNLLALFENWDQYTKTLDIAENATGTLQEQQDIYMESTEAHLQQLSTTAEEMYNTIFDTDAINTMIDGLTGLLEILNNFLSSLGGGMSTLSMLGVMGANVFSNQIGGAIEKALINQEKMKANQEALAAVQTTANLGMSPIPGDTSATAEVYKEQADTQERILNLSSEISSEEYNRLTDLNSEITLLKLAEAAYDDIQNKQLDGIINAEDSNKILEEADEELEYQKLLYEAMEESQNKVFDAAEVNLNKREEEVAFLNQEKDLQQFLADIDENQYLTEEQKIQVKQAQADLLNGDIPLEQSLTTILEAQKSAVEQANVKREEAKRIVEELAKYEGTDIETITKKYKALEQVLKEGGTDANGNVLLGLGQHEQQENISNVTRSLSSLMMEINAVTNAINVLTNDDLSPWEKFSQIASNLVFVIPTLINSFNSWKGTIDFISSGVSQLAASLGITVGALGGVAVAIGAAVAVVAAAGVQIYNFYNSASIAADEAAASAERLAAANDEVADSIANLNSLIDTYDNAVEKLEECTGDTEEWKKAIDETNEAALALIESISAIDLKNAGLDSIADLYDTENGLIVINEDNLKKITDAASTLSASSELASAYADYSAEIAQGTADLVSATRSAVNSTYSTSHDETGNYNGITEATRWEKVISANVDSLSRATGGTEDFREALSALGLNVDNLSTETLENLRTSVDDLALASDTAAEKLKLIASTEISGLLNDEELSEAATSIVTRQTLQLEDQIADILETLFTTSDISKEEAAQVGYSGDLGINIWSDASNAIYDWLLKQLNAAGYNYSAASNPVVGTDSNRSFKFLDENGKELEALSAREVAVMIASSQAIEELGNTAEDSVNFLKDFNGGLAENGGKGLTEALNSWIGTGSFDSSALSSVINDLIEKAVKYTDEGEDVSEGLAYYLQKILIDAVDDLNTGDWDEADEMLKEYLGEDYADQIYQAAEDYYVAFENVGIGFRQAVQDALAEFDDSDLSISTKEAVGQILQDTLGELGNEYMNQMSATLQKVADDGELDDFIAALEELDEAWGTVTYEDFISAMQDMNITTDFAEGELWDFCAVMNDVASTLISDADSLRESYKTVHDITDSLDTGSAISEDDYNTLLEELGSGVSTYFTQMLDGTYKLTASAEDFQKAVQNYYVGQVHEVQGQSQENIEHAQTVQSNLPTLSNYSLESLQTESRLPYDEHYRENIIETIDAYQQLTNASEEDRQALLKLQDAMDEGLSEEQIGQLQEYIDEIDAASEQTGNFNQIIAEEEENIRALDLALAESYTSTSDLRAAMEEGAISADAFNQVYLELNEASRMEGLDSDEVSDYAKHLQEVCGKSETLSKDLTSDDKAAKSLATQILRMNNGVEELADGLDDWADMLKNSSKSSQEYYEALSDLRSAMSDLLDINEDFLSEDFLTENLDDMALAAQGDADAIDRLRAAAAEDIWAQLEVKYDSAMDELGFSLSDLQAMADMYPLEIGETISIDEAGENEFIDSLNALIDATAMTTDEVTALLGSMGYDVTFEEGEDSVTSVVPRTTKHHTFENYSPQYDDNGNLIGASWDETEEVITENVPVTEEMGEISTMVESGEYSSGGGISSGGVAHVAGVTKKATGASNNGSSRNAGGNPSSGGSGGGGGGGGSGSGSGSTEEPAHEDYLEGEIDRYHDINIRLKEISTSLARLQNQENKLFGSALLDNLNAQLATLNDQIDATNEKLVIAQGEASELRSSLSSQGVKFDSEGNITNYASAMQSQLDYVNKIVDKYNSMSAEQQEAYQDTLDKAKEDYDNFVQQISDYDTLISETIPGLVDDVTEATNQQIQIQIQKFTMEIEIRLDMSEAERDWNKFYRKVILGISDDDILGGATQDLADLLSYFNTTASDITETTGGSLEDWSKKINEAITGGGTGSIQALTDQINDTLAQLEQIDATGWSDVYGDNQAQALEDLQTYYEELMDELEDVQDLVEDIEESYLDMIDEAIDAFEEQVDQYEYINDLLNHDINLVSLLYGDDAYEQMNRYYEQIEANNNAELDFLRQRVDYAAQMMELETDEEARKKWQDEWEDALEALNDKVEDSVQNIIDKYTNVVNQIISELNDSLTNGLGLDYVGEEWDLMNQEADIYLDTINRLYSIQDLRNKWQDAIDSTDDLAAQQKLTELMEEQIGYLEEKGELTQYDVDRAELEYEIALKQIALDEAQRNKSTMRLRRDAQGNYTYQYVSDQDAVADAQAELLELQNELYNMDKDAYKDNLDQLYSVYEEYQQKLLELYEDQTLSAEEREEKIAMYAEYYGNIINDLTRENTYIRTNLEDSAMNELAALYEIDVENFKNMSAEEQDELMNSLIPQWDSSIQHMADTFINEGGFIPACEEALKELNQATEDYEIALGEMATAAGIDLEQVTNGYDTASEAAQNLVEDNYDLISSWDDAITTIQMVTSAVQDLTTGYDAATSSAKAAAAAAKEYITAANEAAATAASNDNSNSAKASDSGNNKKSGSDSGSGSGNGTKSSSDTGSGNGKVELGDKVLLNSGKYYASSYGDGPTGSKYVGTGQYLYVTATNSSGSYPYHLSSKNVAPSSPANQYQIGWVKKSQISGYDTGGYTGEWDGSDGALALLHQKEIVLNKEDTENLLSAVGIVRDVATMLDSLNTSVLNKVSNLVTGLSQMKLHDKEDKVLEQDVHIEAMFPNVRDSAEIEQAFNNLVNVASQHAYNTQR